MFPLTNFCLLSLSSATNVAYIFWLTLYQDGRRLGTWPKAMHKPINCYLSYQLNVRGYQGEEGEGGVDGAGTLSPANGSVPSVGQANDQKSTGPLESWPNCKRTLPNAMQICVL